ncbi:MAG TPA: HlyD family secretion protein [Balneolaceae bacterium]|nr:HlyD family secretion protein [Balneolaceae bacterium]
MSDNEQKKQANGTSRQDQKGSDENRGISTTKKYILYGLLAVLIIGGLVYGWRWYQYAQTHESTKNAHIEGHISPVIPQVKGYIKHIYVNDNEKVKKGQLLATIDKRDYRIGVKQAKANVAGAKAGYQDAKANWATSKSQKNQAKVHLNQAKTEYKRQKRLLNDHSTTQQKYDQAKYTYQAAQARYDVARQQVKAAQIRLKQAKTQIDKAQSSLENAQLQLSYTKLTAPIAGRVSKKNIETGQFVSPGNSVMAIASDDSVWVVANFKEGQIANIKAGQPVKINVDAYPDTTFKGQVQSLAGATGSKFALLPPDNASGNFVKVEQRIPVKIVFTGGRPVGPSGKPLKPGMNVEPTVNISK